MDVCFDVLDNSKDALKNPKADTENRSDPVYVSRMITAMVTNLFATRRRSNTRKKTQMHLVSFIVDMVQPRMQL